MRGFCFLPANPRRPDRGSCARHTDRSEGAPETVTDRRDAWQRRCGAGVPPCRDYICRTHRGRIRTHRRGHDRSISSRSVGLRQRKRACEREGCCQRDCRNFHEVSLLSLDRRQPHRRLDRSTKIFVRRDGSRQAVHISQSRDAPALSCFHSSASTSQYSISEYSISFLASAARSRHMASNAANCFFEYMGFPVVALYLMRSLSRPTDNFVMRLVLSVSMFPNV